MDYGLIIKHEDNKKTQIDSAFRCPALVQKLNLVDVAGGLYWTGTSNVVSRSAFYAVYVNNVLFRDDSAYIISSGRFDLRVQVSSRATPEVYVFDYPTDPPSGEYGMRILQEDTLLEVFDSRRKYMNIVAAPKGSLGLGQNLSSQLTVGKKYAVSPIQMPDSLAVGDVIYCDQGMCEYNCVEGAGWSLINSSNGTVKVEHTGLPSTIEIPQGAPDPSYFRPNFQTLVFDVTGT